MASAIRGFFDNGGKSAYVLNVAPEGGLDPTPDDFIGQQGNVPRGLQALERIDDVDIVIAPDLMTHYKKSVAFQEPSPILPLQPPIADHSQTIPGRGIRIWGARTLSSDPSFVQINVRRLYILIRKSIEKYAQWVVFEPNEESLWKKIVRSCEDFLNDLWREGALIGADKGEAFYVKCDEETNPPEARDVGELIVEIGISPVKPAEFIVVRIHQWTRERTDADKPEPAVALAATP